MENVVVTIEDGQVKGQSKLNYDGNWFVSFQGIPYAKPPLGHLRFKAPQPVDPWTGVFDATKEGSECYSLHMLTREFVGTEDCLYINVYTPKLPSKNEQNPLKPVMVFIHGGGFIYGSSKTELYGPEFLLTEDIVLVTFNYRLGILGFLSLEDSTQGVPGNAGLKDMVLALKWIQKNVSKFSGDPNNVTIFGESAGAAAVHYLLLSPLTKGLFHKAILQSGCAINYWAKGFRVAKELAEALNFDTREEKEILKRLRETPLPDLIKAQINLGRRFNIRLGEVGIFAPIIEKPSDEPALISEEALKIVKAGKFNDVPVIFGYNSEEGILHDVFKKILNAPPSAITDFEEYVPHLLNLERGSKQSKEVAQKIRNFFFGDEEPTLNNKDREYKLDTDTIFFREIHTSVRELIKISKSPVYFYKFSLDTTLNLFKMYAQIHHKGACHADDLGYLFQNAFTPAITPGSPEDAGIRVMVKLWTTFAATGNPTPKNKRDKIINVDWPSLTKDAFNYLEIGENLSVKINPEADRIAFWDEIFKKYGNKM